MHRLNRTRGFNEYFEYIGNYGGRKIYFMNEENVILLNLIFIRLTEYHK